MKTRTNVLNHLAEKYQLKRYLEIGLQRPEQNFDKIKCEYKVSVDPDPESHATFIETSDKFFSRGMNDELNFFNPFDLIFIDGLHTAEQVKKDFENALKILSPNGFIVLHDCNPEKEEHTIVPRAKPSGHWNGSCYKFAASVQHPKITVDIDNGCTILNESFPFTVRPSNHIEDISWDYFNAHRKELLNLVIWDDFILL